jgi:hypothetical protein
MARPSTFHDWRNCDCTTLCRQPIRIALVSFTITGLHLQQVRRPRYGSGAFSAAYDPAEFERRLQAGHYDASAISVGYYLRDAPVIDKRALLRKNPSVVIASPMLEPELEDHQIAECPTPSIADALAQQAARGGDATYHTLLQLQRQVRQAGMPYGPLDHVSTKVYVEWWRVRGARIGHITSDGNAICWPDAQQRKPSAVQGELGL